MISGIASTCACHSAFAQPKNADPTHKTYPENGSNQPEASFEGCAFSGTASQLDSLGFSEQCTSLKTLQYLMHQETAIMNAVFGVAPSFGCFNDYESPNALATSANLVGSSDGTVLFGRRLIVEEAPEMDLGTSIGGIMAHEWAHIRQFREGIQRSSKSMELHADCCAGWYLGWKFANGKKFDGWGFAYSLFSKGDYQFNSPSHHGTPDERVRAMVTGYEIATSRLRGVIEMNRVRHEFRLMFSQTSNLFG